MNLLARFASLFCLLCVVAFASGQTIADSILLQFGPGIRGYNPSSGVLIDSSGDLFGLVEEGGAYGYGGIWEIAAPGFYNDFYDFQGATGDGANPVGTIAIDAHGSLYGVSNYGGANYDGMVWEVYPFEVDTNLHSFKYPGDGYDPQGGVAFDTSGNLYGTTESGGANDRGIIWEITAGGTYKDLHDFNTSDGAFPMGGVATDTAGNVYGTTSYGGALGSGGNVWEITSSGVFKDLHDFGGPTDGYEPEGGIGIDASGNLYGTASEGGTYGDGIIWEISATGYRKLHDFGAAQDGQLPFGKVTIDAAGDLFGTTRYGGSTNSSGTIWEIPFLGSYQKIHDFGVGTDGVQPQDDVAVDTAGNLYGTTISGGPDSYGTVWEISFLSSLSVSPQPVVGGNNATGTVTITGKAPTGGAVISLSSNSAEAQVPATVTIPAGQTSTTFPITTSSYSSTVVATITASEGATVERAFLPIAPPTLASVSLNPSTVGGGASTTGTVTLTGTAPAGGVAVSLRSSSADTIVPFSVTVPAGQSSASFSISTLYYPALVKATITAGSKGVSQQALLTITVPVLSSVTVNPSTVQGGTSCTGTVTLNGPAPSGGAAVYLTSSSADALVPSSVTVLAGQSSANFTISTLTYPSNVKATITAGERSVSEQATLWIDAPAVASVSLNPATVVGGAPTTGTVTLTSPALSGGTTVALASSSSVAQVASSVTVPAGQTTATFQVTTTPYTASVKATIWATADSVRQGAVLSISAASLSSLTLNPSSVIGGSSTTGTATLSGPAPTGGVVVYLSSSSQYATVPLSVAIPAGQTSATFPVGTNPFSSTLTAVITGKAAGSQTVTLTIQPATVLSVSVNPSTVTGGTSSTGTVTLTGPAPAGGLVVVLLSSSSSAQVPYAVVVPAGQSSATFTVTTTTVSSTTSVTITGSANSSSSSTTLTLTP